MRTQVEARAPLECGDSSPLYRGDLSPSEIPTCGYLEEHRALNAPCRVIGHAAEKAVTGHRTPKAIWVESQYSIIVPLCGHSFGCGSAALGNPRYELAYSRSFA